MTSLADTLTGGPEDLPRANRAKPKHPSGWEPRVIQEGDSANVVTKPIEGNPDHQTLLRESELDPEHWRIIGDIQVRRWQQTEEGPWLRYFKFNASSDPTLDDPEWEKACKQVLAHKPRAPKARAVKHARVVCLADWQAGKGEGGGSIALADRIQSLMDELVAICKNDKPDALYLVGMGDMVERCQGNYPSQAFTTDLNEREQERFARRAILAIIKAVAPLVPRLVVSCVPGNHGENRNASGKSFTTNGDNADVAVFEQVMDVLNEAPAYKHVSWVIPNEDLTVTMDIAGTIVAFAHGHQFRRGGSVQQKAVNWWKGQAMGRHGPGDADVLVSGHYHHWQALSTHGRLWLQCPSLDGGSGWFTDTTGEHSMPGTLTFKVTETGAKAVTLIE